MYELVALYIYMHYVHIYSCCYTYLCLNLVCLCKCLPKKRQCVLFVNSTGNPNFCGGTMIFHDYPIKMIFTDFYQHFI